MYKQAYPDLAAKPGHPQTYMPYGIPPAMAVVNALKAAGPQPTREKVLAALETMKFDSGVMAGPIEFGPNDRAAQESAIYIKFDGTSMSLVPALQERLAVPALITRAAPGAASRGPPETIMSFTDIWLFLQQGCCRDW